MKDTNMAAITNKGRFKIKFIKLDKPFLTISNIIKNTKPKKIYPLASFSQK